MHINTPREQELRQRRIDGAQAFQDKLARTPPEGIAFMDQMAWLGGWDAAKAVVDHINSLPEN